LGVIAGDPEISEEETREALDRIVNESLRPVSLGLSFLFLLFAAGHVYMLAPPAAAVMTPTALLSAMAYFLLYRRLRRSPIRLRRTHAVAAGITGIALLNCLFHLILTRDSQLNFNIILVEIGAGCFFLSREWLRFALVAAFACWAAVALLLVPLNPWLEATGLLIAFLLHEIRLKTYSKLVRLGSQNRRRKEELERAIRTIRQSEERYRRLSDASFEGIFIQDRDRILDFNPAFAEMFGYSPEELKAIRVSDLFDPQWRERLRKLLPAHPEESTEILSIRKSGERFPALLRGRTVTHGEEPVLIIAILDITERKRIEEESVLARDSALEAARLKSEFMTNMSHEIRTPLNAVIGMTDLLFDTDLTFEQRECAETIRHAGEALLSLVNDILDFSKIEAGKMQPERVPFNLSQAVESASDLLAVRAKSKGIDLSVSFSEAVPRIVYGDPDRLRQALLNLIGNAVKFTDEGGVAVRVVKERETESRIWLRFVIQDTGIGIAPDGQRSLFQPFYQADGSLTRRYGGTGLGLAISKQLIELMGGEIGMESEAGSGSTFWFALPMEAGVETEESAPLPAPTPDQDEEIPAASPPAGPASASEGVSSPAPAAPTRRILVAEDNEFNRKVTLSLLQKIGYGADAVSDGQEALDALAERAYDLVLMDCQMPVTDGYEASRKIRERENGNRKVIIVALTANVLEGDVERCFAAGMDDYLAKPVRMAALKSLLARWLSPAAELDEETEPVPQSEEDFFDAPLDLRRLRALRAYQSEGEPDILMELLDIFYRDAPQRLEALEEAMKTRDFETLRRTAHSLAGAGANVGAAPLGKLARELEESGRKEDSEGSRRILDDLKKEWERVRAAIEEEGKPPAPME
jgi:PAS domain S-box-containing protein